MLLVGLVGVAPRADRSGKIVAEFTLKVRVECPGQCRMYRRHTEFTHRLEHLGCSGNLVALREPTDPPVLIDDAILRRLNQVFGDPVHSVVKLFVHIDQLIESETVVEETRKSAEQSRIGENAVLSFDLYQSEIYETIQLTICISPEKLAYDGHLDTHGVAAGPWFGDRVLQTQHLCQVFPAFPPGDEVVDMRSGETSLKKRVDQLEAFEVRVAVDATRPRFSGGGSNPRS